MHGLFCSITELLQKQRRQLTSDYEGKVEAT